MRSPRAASIGFGIVAAGQAVFLIVGVGASGGFGFFDTVGTIIEGLGIALAAAGARSREPGSANLAAGLGVTMMGRLIAWAPGAIAPDKYAIPGGVGLVGLLIAAWGALRWPENQSDASAARVVSVGCFIAAFTGFLWIPIGGIGGLPFLPGDLLIGVGFLVASWGIAPAGAVPGGASPGAS